MQLSVVWRDFVGPNVAAREMADVMQTGGGRRVPEARYQPASGDAALHNKLFVEAILSR